MSDLQAKRDELEELYDYGECASEALAETECQYKSEVALFGDAWPGAAIQLDEMRSGLHRAEKRIEELKKELGILPPPKVVYKRAEADEIPF